MLRIKICGITRPDQGRAIAQSGATALGFMCVRQSPRYVVPQQIRAIVDQLPDEKPVDRVGVFADATIAEIGEVVAIANLNAVQLHGSESPQFCHQLRSVLPQVELIKALRIRDLQALAAASFYNKVADTLLLDAYHPNVLGGTGKTLDWSSLQDFSPDCPWILAGGITPDNVQIALTQLRPQGIDLSSGVEHAPGNKDLNQIARLFEQIRLLSR
jgi:phosphoribosylanthranilate isomerase